MTSTTTNNNIKSWGDVSSDDDSDDDVHPRPIPSYKSNDNGEDDDDDDVDTTYPSKPQYTIPSNPPYTSYIGNISYEIRNTSEFCTQVQEMLIKRNVTGFSTARLMMDRDSDRNKGYGYIEFTSGKELLAFLELDKPQLCGRDIKVDISTGSASGSCGGGNDRDFGGGRRSSGDTRMGAGGGGGNSRGGGEGRDSFRRGGGGNNNDNNRDSFRSGGGGRSSENNPIDASKWREGRYSGVGDNLRVGGGGGAVAPTAVMKRANSSGGSGASGSSNTTASQRPSLKLAPRTKPIEGSELPAAAVTSSSIFGGAKPRDETNFVAATNSKESVKQPVVATTTATPVAAEKEKSVEKAATRAPVGTTEKERKELSTTENVENIKILKHSPIITTPAVSGVTPSVPVTPSASDASLPAAGFSWTVAENISDNGNTNNNDDIASATALTTPYVEGSKNKQRERRDSRGNNNGRGRGGRDGDGRRDSKSSASGGRGGGRGEGGSGMRKENSDRSSFSKGRGEGGRGEGRGGRQGENNSDRSIVKGREGRGGGNKSEKRLSRTKKNGGSSSAGDAAESNGNGRNEAKSDDEAVSSLAKAASVKLPTLHIAPDAKKGMPSKKNSYALLEEEEDED